MGDKKPTGEVPTIAPQPPVQFFPNEPASSVGHALKNSAAQVAKANAAK